MPFHDTCPYWLRRLAKDLPVPDVLWIPRLEHAAAEYWSPSHPISNKWCEETSSAYDGIIDWYTNKVGRRYLTFKRGLILLSINSIFNWPYPERDLPAILAHEWCHHWQAYNRPFAHAISFDPNIPYGAAMWKYFHSSPREFEALRFELAVASCDENRYRASLAGWDTKLNSYFVPLGTEIGSQFVQFAELH